MILALGWIGQVGARASGKATHVSRPLYEVEAKLNDHIVFTAQDLRDLARYPSEQEVTRQSRRYVIETGGAGGGLTYFFMTCRLTLVMSTFWPNSGGNLVLLRSFASTPVAMVRRMLDMRCRLRCGRGNERCSGDVGGSILL